MRRVVQQLLLLGKVHYGLPELSVITNLSAIICIIWIIRSISINEYISIVMYIHKSVCISPQHTFSDINIEEVVSCAASKMSVIEPKYENIPLNILRRMGKAVRMGVGAAMPLVKDYPELNGIIIGTANGGMEDCIKFLCQVIKYNEGTLTPTNFVQSTNNAIAAQIGLSTHNNNYNITHVHRGLAFENSLLDAMMLLAENPNGTYLLGSVDEISSYNYNLERLGGWYKKETVSNADLYKSKTPGTMPGEHASMFIVNDRKEGSSAKVKTLKTLHTDNVEEVTAQLQLFLQNNLSANQEVDLFLSGENGDSRHNHFYFSCEKLFNEHTAVARFKHLCGEHPTAVSFALWLGCFILSMQQVPRHILKNSFPKGMETHSTKSIHPAGINTILIYNNCKGLQHGFILVEKE